MEMKSLLNDFEYDWASFPARQSGFPAAMLRGKSVIVAGVNGNFVRSVVFSLLAANDLRDLQLSVILLTAEEYMEGISRDLSGRDELRCFAFGKAPEELPRADIVIDTAMCNAEIQETPEFFMQCVGNIKYTLDCTGKTGAQHFILLSDYRVYEPGESLHMFSENEGGAVNSSGASPIATLLMQTLESYTAAYASDGEFKFTVLRCANLLGADAGFDDGFAADMLRAAAFGSSYRVRLGRRKISFVYISDVLNAVFRACTDLPENTVYNVVGKDSTVSLGELSAMLYDLYPDKVRVKLYNSVNEPYYGVPMNGGKISSNGVNPEITLKQAVQLVVRSQLHDDLPFALASCGGEKLRAVRTAVLLCLLEIDRICRRNKIRYFLTGDLLLGAVRFKGFIPWGGDAAVMMLRGDYDRFIEAANEFPNGLILSSFDRGERYGAACAKLIVNTAPSGKMPDSLDDCICVDIISQERTTNGKTARWFHINMIRRSKRKYRQTAAGGGKNPLKKLRAAAVKKRLNSLLHRYENKKDARFLYDGLDKNARIGYFPRKWMKNAVYWDFEGYRFPIPKDYDRYLKYLYGDYKNDTAVSLRQPGKDYENVDLGKYENICLPSHPYHNISMIKPIKPVKPAASDGELPKSYPGRVDAENFAMRGKRRDYANEADRLSRNEEEQSAEVKVFTPKKRVEQDTGGGVSASEDTKPAESAVPRIDATMEFSLGETTDISKFSDSSEMKKLADTREFELPQR